MSRPFIDLLRRLGILRQRMWLWPSRIVCAHLLSQQERGDPVLEDEVWKHEVGYIKWFYFIMIAHAPVADYTTLISPY